MAGGVSPSGSIFHPPNPFAAEPGSLLHAIMNAPAAATESKSPGPSVHSAGSADGSAASLPSHDGKPHHLQLPIPTEPVKLLNGNAVTSSNKKTTTMAKLGRMFSTTKVAPHNEDSSTNSHRGSQSGASDSGHDGPHPPSRQSSYSSKDTRAGSVPATDRRTSVAQQSKSDHKADQRSDDCHKRFELHPDGTHAHLLKSAKRQEKLTGMLRDMMMGGKKKDDRHSGEEQHLSLMSTWIDQLKSEREKLAADQKGGPNNTASLVQKYGKCQEVVGRGAFGVVRISHKANDPRDSSRGEQLYAVKEFRRRPQESPKKYQKRLTSEFCISSSLRHPNVIHTLDLLQDAKGDYCEVMEFCAGGDLYTLVLAAGKLEVVEADCYFKQLMRGVEYLHEMGVAHRDLKPENLLLTTHGALKITDFGNGECFRMAWEKEAHMVVGLCGSAPYIAPEEYVDSEFDPRAVDVWATGVIYMAMRTGRHLWRVAMKDEDEFFERYLEGRRDEDGYGPIETLHRVRSPRAPFSDPC